MSNVKDFLTDIVAFVIFLSVIFTGVWLLGSFIELNFNFFDWALSTRVFVVVVTLVLALIARD